MTSEVFDINDTSHLLRMALGRHRNWHDTLSDMRCGRCSIAGHVLLPCGVMGWQKGNRPLYARADIETFMRDAFKATLPATVLRDLHGEVVELDPFDTRHWRDRPLQRASSLRRPPPATFTVPLMTAV